MRASTTQVTVDGQRHSMALSQQVWDYAERTRARRQAARLPPSCRFYNIYGTGEAWTHPAWWDT